MSIFLIIRWNEPFVNRSCIGGVRLLYWRCWLNVEGLACLVVLVPSLLLTLAGVCCIITSIIMAKVRIAKFDMCTCMLTAADVIHTRFDFPLDFPLFRCSSWKGMCIAFTNSGLPVKLWGNIGNSCFIKMQWTSYMYSEKKNINSPWKPFSSFKHYIF